PAPRRSSNCSRMTFGAFTSAPQEIAHELGTVRCQYAFRMKLHALDVQRSMAYTHDLTLRCARSDFQHGGNAGGLRDQRVISASLEILRHACIQPLAVMDHRRDLAMH